MIDKTFPDFWITVLYCMVLLSAIFPEFDPSIFVCSHTLVVWPSGASDNRKDTLTQLDDEDDMSPED